MENIDLHLQRLRQVGDAPLKPCSFISDEFIAIPPHKVGVAHLVLKPRFLLADPVGCGKTPQALVAFAFLKQREPNLRLLVHAERSAIYQWHLATRKFLRGIRPSIVGYDLDSGSPVGRHARYKAYESQDSDVYLLSYPQMARDIDAILGNMDNYVVAFDEVQHLKTQRIDDASKTRSSLYTAALKLSLKARYCWGLSATPQMNGRLEELYAIMEVIRPGTFGSFESFKARYMEYETQKIYVGGRARWIPKLVGYRNVPEMMKILRPFYLKRPSSLINKHLPKVVPKQVMLEMLPQQAALYEEIRKKRFSSPITGRRINALGALTYAQLCSDGPITLGHDLPSSKMVELKRFFAEEHNDEKVIIYARFRRTVDYIRNELTAAGIRNVHITGKVKTKAREDARLVFQDASSGVNVICINKAGGSSLDLQQASIVIFYDLPWSWGEWDQVLGRARRIGSPHEKVLALILTNQGTIDQHALEVLQFKERLVDEGIGLDEGAKVLSEEIVRERLYGMVRGDLIAA